MLAGCADDAATSDSITSQSAAGDTAASDSTDAQSTQEGSVGSTAVTTTDESETTADEGSTPVSGVDPGLKPFIDIAVADLGKRFSIDPGTISVVSATLVSWPDSSLGCTQPGQQYAQVVTDGSLIILKVGNTLYPYHAGGSRKPFLCEPPSGLGTANG